MNPLRTLVATLVLAASAGCAVAAPVLKADVVVNTPIVTVGDMFDDAGTLAEAPLFRAPAPGTTGSVDLAAVTGAAARAGMGQFDVNGLTQVRVTREGTIIDQALLTGLIVDDMRNRGIVSDSMTANLVFSRPLDSMTVAASDRPAQLESLRYLPGSNSFSARFLLAGIERPLDVDGTVDMSIEAPHLAAALPAGTVLRPQDIVMRPVPVQQADAQGIPSLGQLVGMALNRQSRDGMLLRASDVSTPLAIAKNDLVTIYYRKGPMTLTVKGQAVTGAAQGGSVQILNLVSRRVINATAIAPGAVEVTNQPMTLAGL